MDVRRSPAECVNLENSPVFMATGFSQDGLAKILHTIFSWLDYFHPKPSPLVVLIAVALVIGVVVYLRRRSTHAPAAG